MKNLIVIITLFLSNYSFSQTYNQIEGSWKVDSMFIEYRYVTDTVEKYLFFDKYGYLYSIYGNDAGRSGYEINSESLFILDYVTDIQLDWAKIAQLNKKILTLDFIDKNRVLYLSKIK